MIEGDFNAVEIFDPGHRLGIVSGFGFLVFRPNEKGDGANVATGIALGLGIDADKRKVAGFDACLFHQLAFCCVLHGLANVNEASRQSEIALEGGIFPPDHEHTPVGVHNDTVGGEKRRFGRRHDNSIYVESRDMKTAVSAGLLLYRRRQGLEVLLAHPGGPYWRNKDDGAWMVPKGEIHDDEDPQEAALREFEEETGFHPEGKFVSLGSLRQAGGKQVHVWAIEGDWDPATLDSNYFNIEWPPRSGRTSAFPEIDRAAWFDIPTACRKILKSQAEFLHRLEMAKKRGEI